MYRDFIGTEVDYRSGRHEYRFSAFVLAAMNIGLSEFVLAAMIINSLQPTS